MHKTLTQSVIYFDFSSKSSSDSDEDNIKLNTNNVKDTKK